MKRRVTVAAAICSCFIMIAGCSATQKKAGCGGCKTPCSKAGTDASPCSKTGDLAKWARYGQKMKLASAKTICAKEVLADPTRYDGKLVRVRGIVNEVCARKGCWIRLAGPEKGDTLFVKFTCPVDGRLVPMEAAGKLAVVEGTLKVSQISEADARHYKEDAGAPPAEVAKIIGPQKMVNLRAPAALIQGV